MTAWSLDALLDPQGADAFFASSFEKQRLFVQRDRPDYFASLLTLDDIDRILTTLEASDEDISLVNAASPIKYSDYVYGDDSINADRLFRLHEAGATVILNHLHRRHPPLAELCAALELEFSALFQANVYLTPPAAQGFKPHFDTHDVFVLQIAGSKRWRLYGTPVDRALKGHGDDARQDDPGPVGEELEMCAGDTLYIPRGLVHDAKSTGETSLHVTVGVMAWTWFDFLLEAVETLASRDREARAALPPGFARPGFDRESFRETFAGLARRLASEVDAGAVLDRFTDRFTDQRRPFLRGQMKALAQASSLTAQSRVGCRPFLSCRITCDEERVNLRLHGNEISFPAYVEPALRHALETREFRIADMPGDLDDEGRLVLARRLVREGLLRPLDAGEADGAA